MKRTCILLIVAVNVYGTSGPSVLADVGGANAVRDASSVGLGSQNSRMTFPGPLAQDSAMPEPTTACLFLIAAAAGLCHHPRRRGARRLPRVKKPGRSCATPKGRKTPESKSPQLLLP